ncbi:DUF3224 domain-containing protein [Cryomorphaceae bacterium 1068]|nr:DUF3224 domain-containing protein [Cryomorphaceae bacterium 1068]
MSKTISGSFEVKLQPLESSAQDPLMGRMSIDKSFTGPLEGSSKGEMLTARTAVDSTAGYVAIEKFSGILEGKKGGFVLQHFGIMSGGNNRLILEVLPDSGTDELMGISGKMEIKRDRGHHYDFHYDLI